MGCNVSDEVLGILKIGIIILAINQINIESA